MRIFWRKLDDDMVATRMFVVAELRRLRCKYWRQFFMELVVVGERYVRVAVVRWVCVLLINADGWDALIVVITMAF